MKRYRLTNFYINAMQTGLRNPALQGAEREREIEQLKSVIAQMRGSVDIDEKFERWMELDLYTLRSRVEFEDFIEQVADAYVSKLDFPALTGACCIRERILNILILKLREHFRSSEHYPDVHRAGSFCDWPYAMEVLEDWGILNTEMLEHFNALKEIRHRRVHYQPINNARADALQAIKHALWLTHAIFGVRADLTFMTVGEIYVKKAVEASPLVMEFFLPSCIQVGYKYRQEGPVIHDEEPYENREITDEEFSRLRREYRSTPPARPT